MVQVREQGKVLEGAVTGAFIHSYSLIHSFNQWFMSTTRVRPSQHEGERVAQEDGPCAQAAPSRGLRTQKGGRGRERGEGAEGYRGKERKREGGRETDRAERDRDRGGREGRLAA